MPVAFGAILLTAPIANAIPEGTIKAECKDAGGTYSTSTSGGQRYSSCEYKDIDGGWHSDQYVDGEYTGTIDIAKDAPPPTGKTSVAPLPGAPINPGMSPG
ncbi:hypothetical protein ABQF34_25160 [Mycolicibacterium boenickei]